MWRVSRACFTDIKYLKKLRKLKSLSYLMKQNIEGIEHTSGSHCGAIQNRAVYFESSEPCHNQLRSSRCQQQMDHLGAVASSMLSSLHPSANYLPF
jgi:hypothetical protein